MDYGRRSDIWSKVRVQLKRYFGVLKKYWWLIPLTTSAGTCIAAWVVAQMPPTFQSQGTMYVGGQVQLNEATGYSEERQDFYGTQIKIMESAEVQQRALARVQTLHPELKPEAPPTLEVTLEPGASVFDLQVTAHTATFAQAYLEACMEEYIDTKKNLRRQRSDDTTVAISDEMARLNKEMESNDASMLQFQKENNIGFLQEEGNSAAKYLTQLDQQLSNLKTEYNLGQLLDLDQNLDRQQSQAASGGATDAKSDSTLTSYGPIADYQKARQDIALLKAQLADKSQYLKPKHPDIISLKDQIVRQENLIVTLRAQSMDALKTHQETLRLQIENLETVIKEQQAKALDLSSRLSEFDKLKTNSDRTKAEYDRLLANFQSVDVTRNVDQDAVSIYDHASEGVSAKPGPAKVVMTGVGGGILVAFIILFLIDQFDDRISSLMELQTFFPELLLGQIPQEKFVTQPPLLRVGDDRQALIESFRTLRSSIIFLPIEGKRPKTIVVTSALPNEGKTTVASNLAITLAFSGAKTLFIDGDMRSGQASRLFGAQHTDGLSNILLQKIAWTDAVFMTGIDHLFMIPSGPALHHTSEHLLGKVTDQFIQDIYSEFDYVLFDSPPVIILDDTLSLSPKIDATLFVLRFDQSSTRASRRALELLHGRQANVIGIVVNGVAISESEYNYNYSYRQYGTKYQELKA